MYAAASLAFTAQLVTCCLRQQGEHGPSLSSSVPHVRLSARSTHKRHLSSIPVDPELSLKVAMHAVAHTLVTLNGVMLAGKSTSPASSGGAASNACADPAHDPAGPCSALDGQGVSDQLGPQPVSRLLHLLPAALLPHPPAHECGSVTTWLS